MAAEEGATTRRLRADDTLGYGIHDPSNRNHGITILPDDVMNWSGMNSRAGEMNTTNKASRLVGALSARNDNGATFEEIADLIDAHWNIL